MLEEDVYVVQFQKLEAKSLREIVESALKVVEKFAHISSVKNMKTLWLLSEFLHVAFMGDHKFADKSLESDHKRYKIYEPKHINDGVIN